MDRPDWHHHANCHGQTDLFFPVGRDPDIDDLRPICDTCPVRIDCLDHALTHGEQGVWGGTTETERDRHIRRLRGHGITSYQLTGIHIRPDRSTLAHEGTP